MPIRFVIGRAGAGKTHHCLEAVRARLREDAVCGPRLMLLVPEQAGLQMERAIIDPVSGVGVAHRAEVVSFQRLAVRLLEAADTRGYVALTEAARAMILRRLLAAHRHELRYYARAAREGHAPTRMAGLVERLGRGITELIEEAVDPDDCARAVEQIGDDPSADAAQRAKLHDLALIYRAYVEQLGDRWLDPARRLELARRYLGRCSWLRGAMIWVDGFASFSGQERATLMALARLAAHVDVTLLGDPEALGWDSSDGAVASLLFSKTARTLRDVRSAGAEAGLEIEPPLLLTPRSAPRFANRPALVQLERRLFAADAESEPAAPRESGAVRLCEAPTRRVEVDRAVSCVCDWVQRNPESRRYRYRDVAIIVRDLPVYQDLLSEALSARHIPHFIDRRRPMTNQPLVELLRALVGLAVDGMSLDRVRLLLRCGLLPWDRVALDDLENYLLRHGLSGARAWREPVWRHRRDSNVADRASAATDTPTPVDDGVERTRRALWTAISGWVDFVESDAPKTGAAWRRTILDVWTSLDVSVTLSRLEQDALDRADLDLAEQFREAWKQVCSLLEDLAFVFGAEALAPAELEDVLESGLAQVSLGLVPPMIDQVLVGSIERSRHPDVKAAAIIGFNDGVFPRVTPEESILDDEDRSRLETLGLPVGVPQRTRVLDESMLAYIALTRPSEEVVVTWSTSDERGRALRPSPYVHALRQAAPSASFHAVTDPARDRSMWDLLAPADLLPRLALEFRGRDRAVSSNEEAAGRWNQLYENHRTELAAAPVDRHAIRSLAARPHASNVPAALVDAWCRGMFRASVSSLESYAACPFQFFAQRMLRLSRRVERALEPIDVGNIHHAVLEDFFAQVSTRSESFGAMSDAELRAELEASCARIGSRLEGDELLSQARDAYVLSRSARRLARVARAQRAAAEGSRARPNKTELAFGRDEQDALPGLSITTPKGRRALLSGFIDRVDLAELGDEMLGIVVDYKTGRGKRLDLSRVYHGLSLQLLGYLLVLRDSGYSLAGRSIRPGGALFQSLAPEYAKVIHPRERASRDAKRRGVAWPRGMLSETSLDVLDAAGQSGYSEHYKFMRSRDGRLGNVDKSDGARDDEFDAILAHVRRRLGELVDGVLDGDVTVRPYRMGGFSPCSWCEMGEVCRFEFGLCDVDRKQRFKRSEVFTRVRIENGDEPA